MDFSSIPMKRGADHNGIFGTAGYIHTFSAVTKNHQQPKKGILATEQNGIRYDTKATKQGDRVRVRFVFPALVKMTKPEKSPTDQALQAMESFAERACVEFDGISRVDYCFNVLDDKEYGINGCDDQTAAYFDKLCHIVEDCFAAKYRLSTEEGMLGLYRKGAEFAYYQNTYNTGARTLSMSDYNKKKQKPGEHAKRRFELRYARKKRYYDHPDKFLKDWIDILRTLLKYYDEAAKQEAEYLFAFWQEAEATDSDKKGSKRSPAQFLSSYYWLVFSREQVRYFFELVGKHDPRKATYNFFSRYHLDVPTHKDVQTFIDFMIADMKKFMEKCPKEHSFMDAFDFEKLFADISSNISKNQVEEQSAQQQQTQTAHDVEQSA